MHVDEPVPYMSEDDGESMVKEKHEQMVRNRLQAGKEIPTRVISQSAITESFVANCERYGMTEREAKDASIEYARMACEGSEISMKNSSKSSFLMPDLPWKRIEILTREVINNVGKD